MKTLVLFAHPGFKHSRANRLMLEAAHMVRGITVVDLYSEYPRLDIDVVAEQRRLVEHDAIVFQFPLLWYSTPPIIKQWQDLVLEHGFAYGVEGTRLQGKLCICAVTVGGEEGSYSETGRHRFSLRHLLSPLEATANLCGMTFVTPYVLFNALDAAEATRQMHADGYRNLLSALVENRFDIPPARPNDVMSASEYSARLRGLTS